MEGLGTHQHSFEWYHPDPLRLPLSQNWGFTTPLKTAIYNFGQTSADMYGGLKELTNALSDGIIRTKALKFWEK